MSKSLPLPQHKSNRYALVCTAGITLAVAVEEVGQAFPLDGKAAHLPRRERALLGVCQHRDLVVPIVDLACWGSLRQMDPMGSNAQVLILQKSGMMTGIAIERTVGIVEVAPGGVTRIHHDNSTDELFHSVLQVQGFSTSVPLLDTEHLLKLTQVWVQERPAFNQALGPASNPDQENPHRGNSNAASRTFTEAHVVFEVGGSRFALPVQAVGTLMTTPPIQKLPALVNGLHGVFAWGRRKVPVVHIHHVLGLEPPLPNAPLESRLLVVCTAGESLGVLVDHIVSVQRFESSRLQPSGTPLGTSVVPGHGDAVGRPIQLLSIEGLLSAMPVGAIGADPQREKSERDQGGTLSSGESVLGDQGGGESVVSPEASLVFQAGRVMATPLKVIQEITRWEPLSKGGDISRETHYSWRGNLIPLLDLRFAMEGVASTTGSDARVLIVREGDGFTAMQVESVVDLVPAFSGTLVSLQLNRGRSVQVLTAQVEGQQESYEIVELSHQSRASQDQRHLA